MLLVSNRLPVKIVESEDGLQSRSTAGGLATGLSKPHRDSGGRWIGWAGTISDGDELDPEVTGLLEQHQMNGVPLSQDEYDAYYTRISNRCIWPLFHYFTDRATFKAVDWDVYRTVNRRFADAVLELAQPNDLVFVQDFHLMLVPGMLRDAMPDLRIGFFLHIPFPSSEILRTFPRREEIMAGLLGADVIGFHTHDYARHFRSSARRVLGADTVAGAVEYQGRSVHIITEPLGIDTKQWLPVSETANEAAFDADSVTIERDDMARLIAVEREEVQRALAGRRLILGVERLDYTKGIPERLEAYRALLAEDPSRAKDLLMVQIAVPSRVEVEEYRDLKDEVDRLAGSINSEFGQTGLQPLQYHFRSIPFERLAALYQLADVALVTPLRDGLNLVAKEYVASRGNNDGVLVLGEFCGAAWELGEAVQVNPFDPERMKDALVQALAMSPGEQHRRMRPMRRRVIEGDVHRWTMRLISAIRDARATQAPELLDDPLRARWIKRFRESASRKIFLDYDGTLREFTETPEAAVPTCETIELLRTLASQEGVELWIISGRSSSTLANWLGDTGAGLVSEHGAFMRAPNQTEFTPLLEAPNLEWRDTVRTIFEQVAARVPGSLIEEKPLGLAWHYRRCRPGQAASQARELDEHLSDLLAGQGLEVLRGNKVVEVRPAGISKGEATNSILRGVSEDSFVLVAGDDTTDESMFLRLRDRAQTLLIGHRESAATHRLPSPHALRQFLSELCPVGEFLYRD
ncbi:MAG: trehalose 6-phosphate synthase/phosphatase [Planctomycetota bacterium]